MEGYPVANLEDVLALRRRYNHEQQEGDLCMGIEYLAAHGRALEYFWAQPSQRLALDPGLEGKELESLKIFQNNDNSWELQLRPYGSQLPVRYLIAEETIDQLLANAGEKLYARVPLGQEWHEIEE